MSSKPLSNTKTARRNRRRRLRKRGNATKVATTNKTRQKTGSPTYVRLSECAAMYARVLTDPYGNFPELPCIPDVISLPSYKMRTIARGTAWIGSNGVGWVFFNPFTMHYNNPPVAQAPLQLTTSSYAGTSSSGTPNPFSASASWLPLASDSKFSLLDFANTSVQLRIVGAGVRIRYTGTQLNMGGDVLLVKNPVNQTIAGYSRDVVNQWQQTSIDGTTNKYYHIEYAPDNTQLLSYYANIDMFDSAGTYAQTYCLAFALTGTPNNTFVVEAVQFTEIVGLNFPVTASHADSAGFSAVLSAIQRNTPTLDSSVQAFSKVITKVGANLVSGISGVATSGALNMAAEGLTLSVAKSARAALLT